MPLTNQNLGLSAIKALDPSVQMDGSELFLFTKAGIGKSLTIFEILGMGAISLFLTRLIYGNSINQIVNYIPNSNEDTLWNETHATDPSYANSLPTAGQPPHTPHSIDVGQPIPWTSGSGTYANGLYVVYSTADHNIYTFGTVNNECVWTKQSVGLQLGTINGDSTNNTLATSCKDVFDHLAALQASIAAAANGVPVGLLGSFPKNSIPTGWVACSGQSLARSGTYAALFAYLGTDFGSASGSHFNVPDYRGEFLRSWSNGHTVDSGRVITAAQAGALGPHKHSGVTTTNGDHSHVTVNLTVTDSHEFGAGARSALKNGSNVANQTSSTAGTHTHSFITDNSGENIGIETRPRNKAVLVCIKY